MKATAGECRGTYTKTPKTIIFRYESSLVHSVVVNYIDVATQKVLASTTLSGKNGATYTVALKEIAGYTLDTVALKKERSALTGTFDGNQPAEIRIPYQKIAPPTTDAGILATVEALPTKTIDVSSDSHGQESEMRQESLLVNSETIKEEEAINSLKDRSSAVTKETTLQSKEVKSKTSQTNSPKSKQIAASQTAASNNWSWLLIGAVLILGLAGFGLYKFQSKQ